MMHAKTHFRQVPAYVEEVRNGFKRGCNELLSDLFPMMHATTHFRQVPAYVEEVQNDFKRGCNEALCPSKNERDRPRRNYDLFTITVQLMPGDRDWTKANAFQVRRKIDCRWDKVDYEIARQIANGSPSYEIKDSSSKMKVPHHNRFFLVATPQGASMALCQNEYANSQPDYPFCPSGINFSGV